ncbi:MAG: 16S rRNA (guanine(527)-N(7))-methyltransferase RsmG [Geminicoccaceae bacterium]|nr:16S rRNA (guanine(527)-N(7))-methyltransferase RsmG [Geminicoccaceae bacterium]HRY26237.1 16S rRNA (guanine(527)-N(7))-methyltransferase RsmG [Geminicoccaceae bacterium]
MRREAPLDAAGFAAQVPVSRETVERLTLYLELLRQWQKAINLVGASTLDDAWRRHILDSAQLFRHLPAGCATLADLGSGAGLPGLVLAAMGVPEVHLVESDRRKAQFLREAARRMGLAGVTVHPVRIETLSLAVDVVTARALAPLVQLVPLARPLLRAGGRLVLLKGRGVDAELTALGEVGTMRVELHPSLADPEGRVLVLQEVASSAP